MILEIKSTIEIFGFSALQRKRAACCCFDIRWHCLSNRPANTPNTPNTTRRALGWSTHEAHQNTVQHNTAQHSIAQHAHAATQSWCAPPVLCCCRSTANPPQPNPTNKEAERERGQHSHQRKRSLRLRLLVASCSRGCWYVPDPPDRLS